jgi:hypothetical protein
MQIRRVAAAFVLAPVFLFGQLGSGTVTVTPSNNSNPQPDQALFSVTVNSRIGQSLDGVVTALAGTGISAANLSGVNFQSATPPSNTPPLGWQFQLIVPVAQIQNTTASLLALQKNIAQNNSGLTLSFNLQGTQVSQQLQGTCDFVGLMNNARSEAQSIAGATGFTPGAVVALAGSITQSTPGCSMTVTFGLPVARSGPNTITISASRTTNPPADQAVIEVNVISGLTSGLSDINTALASAGVTGAIFTGVSTETVYGSNSQFQSVLQWFFTVTTPLTKVSSTLTQLAAAQQSVTQQNAAWSLSYYIVNLQASPQSQPVCNEAGLAADARAQAQTIAAAAGVGVGAILNLSDQAGSSSAGIFVSGDFSAIFPGGFSAFGLAPVPSSTCSMSVQFQLL